MKSASNGGILNSSLQMLHIHVLLVAPLGTGHMSQPGADKHEGRIAVRETAHHTSAAADLPVQPFNNIVCMVCCLFSNVCVATSFYQRSANHVSFYFCETYSTWPVNAVASCDTDSPRHRLLYKSSIDSHSDGFNQRFPLILLEGVHYLLVDTYKFPASTHT